MGSPHYGHPGAHFGVADLDREWFAEPGSDSHAERRCAGAGALVAGGDGLANGRTTRPGGGGGEPGLDRAGPRPHPDQPLARQHALDRPGAAPDRRYGRRRHWRDDRRPRAASETGSFDGLISFGPVQRRWAQARTVVARTAPPGHRLPPPSPPPFA